ncbi:MAG: DUF4234 domain-containing protein [Candidatus Woesearchaeota archaeon]
MANQQLVNYIRNTEKTGYSDRKIKKRLLKEGWKEKDIDDAIKEIKQGGEKKAPEKPPEKPKETPAQKSAPAQPGQEASAKPIKKRNPALALIFCIITAGIYGIYWLVSTTKELRRNTGSAPNPWLVILFLVPGVNIIVGLIYAWKYSKAINELTGFSKPLLFILWIIISPVAMVLAQIQLNKKAV